LPRGEEQDKLAIFKFKSIKLLTRERKYVLRFRYMKSNEKFMPMILGESHRATEDYKKWYQEELKTKGSGPKII